ncbi:hypothetical protein KXW38_001987, partial [Aspergillus fumigatus]
PGASIALSVGLVHRGPAFSNARGPYAAYPEDSLRQQHSGFAGLADVERHLRTGDLFAVLSAGSSHRIAAPAYRLLPVAGRNAALLLPRRSTDEDRLHPPVRTMVLTAKRMRGPDHVHITVDPEICAAAGWRLPATRAATAEATSAASAPQSRAGRCQVVASESVGQT